MHASPGWTGCFGRGSRAVEGRSSVTGEEVNHMSIEYTSILEHAAPPPCDRMRARWTRLTEDFVKLPLLDAHSNRAFVPSARGGAPFLVRDVGALLFFGHDQALADAERYVAEGHTRRTGQLVDCDDIDDDATLARWAIELERASHNGWAPPAPQGFWASFLRWRTPLGMARLTDRPSRPRISI